jgi:hypothetical protein
LNRIGLEKKPGNTWCNKEQKGKRRKGKETGMAQDRIKGYVLGSDIADGKKVWKVRIRDESSGLNGKKCVVSSVSDKCSLKKGLDVSFTIGSSQERGQAVLLAFDVEPIVVAEKPEETKAVGRSFCVAVTRYEGRLNVNLTWIEDELSAGLDNIKALAGIPQTRDVLEQILSKVLIQLARKVDPCAS